MCEVITAPGAIVKSGDVWVVPDSGNVVTRFFFMWHEHDRVKAIHVRSDDEEIIPFVKRAMAVTLSE